MDDATKASDAPAPLEYSAKPPLPWVSRHRRKLILLAIVIAITSPIYWFWTPLKLRVLWLYWSHRAAAYQMPDPLVALSEDDPSIAARIVATNSDYVGRTVSSSAGPIPYAVFIPEAFRELRRFDPRLNLTSSAEQALLFMGTRQRPDGTPRLVIVTPYANEFGNTKVWFSVLILPQPGITDPLPQLNGRLGLRVIREGLTTDTEVLTGRQDPSDPTRILFEFVSFAPRFRAANPETLGKGVIEAKVEDDDSLTFRLKSYSGRGNGPVINTSNVPGSVQALTGSKTPTTSSRPAR